MQPPPSARDVLVLAQIVDLVRSGAGTTRPELEGVTGLGRTIVNDRVREGIALGVLAEVEAAPSGQRRGRPSRSIRFRSEAGVILAAFAGRGVAARGGDRPRRPRSGSGVPLHRRAGRSGEGAAHGARVVPAAAAQARVAGARVGGLRRPTRRRPTIRPAASSPPGPSRAGPGSTRVPGSPPATTPRSGWTTRPTCGPWASGSAGSRRSDETCSTSRWPPASAAAWSPAAGCTAATPAPPATSATCASPTTPPPSAAVARPDAWRRSRAAGPSCARSPSGRAPATARCWPNGSPRPAT